MPKVLDYNTLYFLIYALEIYDMFVYKHTKTIEYVKKYPAF